MDEAVASFFRDPQSDDARTAIRAIVLKILPTNDDQFGLITFDCVDKFKTAATLVAQETGCHCTASTLTQRLIDTMTGKVSRLTFTGQGNPIAEEWAIHYAFEGLSGSDSLVYFHAADHNADRVKARSDSLGSDAVSKAGKAEKPKRQVNCL